MTPASGPGWRGGGGGRGRSSRGEEAPGAEEVEDAEEEKDRGDFADAFAVIVVALAIGARRRIVVARPDDVWDRRRVRAIPGAQSERKEGPDWRGFFLCVWGGNANVIGGL